MTFTYRLTITTENTSAVASILGCDDDCVSAVTLELKEEDDDHPIPFIGVFVDLLELHWEELKRLGVCKDDVSVWLLYEYEQECSLEFAHEDLARLGAFGVSLCVSCWRLNDEIQLERLSPE